MELSLTRRALLAGTGASLLGSRVARAAPGGKAVALDLVPMDFAWQSGQPARTAWRFAGEAPRFAQGDVVDITVTNRLPTPVMIGWRGLDAHPELQPWLGRPAITPGASATYSLSLRHAGTLLVDARLLPGGGPLPVLPLVVAEPDPPSGMQDTVLLIEDWRPRPDGGFLPPGQDAAGTEPRYTVNGKATVSLTTAGRLRLRVINGAQRAVLAVQFLQAEVRVIAIDGQPSEPFPAREGRLVLAPGTRIDALVSPNGAACDIQLNTGAAVIPLGQLIRGSHPASAADIFSLPSDGLPDRLALQSALRVTLDLDAKTGWTTPDAMAARIASTFKVARGRPVVLALNNTAETTTIFHLQGHHMRLLDRLDDGWKPFWLDTVAVPGRQTVRVAFAATNAGAYLMDMMQSDWSSPRLFRAYRVEA